MQQKMNMAKNTTMGKNKNASFQSIEGERLIFRPIKKAFVHNLPPPHLQNVFGFMTQKKFFSCSQQFKQNFKDTINPILTTNDLMRIKTICY